jgi:hypothetical protein
MKIPALRVHGWKLLGAIGFDKCRGSMFRSTGYYDEQLGVSRCLTHGRESACVFLKDHYARRVA